MSIVVSDLSERLDTLTKLVLAEPVARIGHSRVTVRPLTLRGKAFFQLEYQQGQKVAHRNVARGALLETFEQELDGLFRSVTLCTETETRQYVRKTNGAYKCTAKSGAARAAVTASHNRKKEYILQEGENIPALVDLGVFTPDFKIVKANTTNTSRSTASSSSWTTRSAPTAATRSRFSILAAANRTSRSCCTTISPSSAACARRSSAMT